MAMKVDKYYKDTVTVVEEGVAHELLSSTKKGGAARDVDPSTKVPGSGLARRRRLKTRGKLPWLSEEFCTINNQSWSPIAKHPCIYRGFLGGICVGIGGRIRVWIGKEAM